MSCYCIVYLEDCLELVRYSISDQHDSLVATSPSLHLSRPESVQVFICLELNNFGMSVLEQFVKMMSKSVKESLAKMPV